MNRKEKRKLERYLGKDFPLDMFIHAYTAYYYPRSFSITESIIDMLKASTHILDSSIFDSYIYDTSDCLAHDYPDDYVCDVDILNFGTSSKTLESEVSENEFSE